MNKRNYQQELDRVLAQIAASDADPKRRPSLFLHSCCAPCSSYVLEYLSPYFSITDFFYNPNITDEAEYRKRADELQSLIAAMRERGALSGPVTFVEGRYDRERWLDAVKGMEDLPEGGERCFACYELRLRESARMASLGGFDFFTTSLSISPLKNAQKINEIGERLAAQYHVTHLPSDFKKRNGYKRSIELSREYDLYRQNYCGCVFSRMARERTGGQD